MSSQTQRDQESSTTPDASLPGAMEGSGPATASPGGQRHRRWPLVVLSVLLVLALAGVGYLVSLARAWEDRAADVDVIARDLGGELAETRAELEETEGTLALVESQLEGAQQQIHELADTAAQFGDDREVQRQVVEYQAELFAAATGVTNTMGECISAQTEYTLALEEELTQAVALLRAQDAEDDDEEPSPEPTATDAPDMAGLREEVVDSCQAAAEAHAGLQERLDNS